MRVGTLTTARRGTAALAVVLLCAGPVHAAPRSAAATATRYEAESATIVRGAAESNHSGYSGTGFVNGDNVVGSYVEFTVDAATAGTARIAVRYSNGTAASRAADIAVGGETVFAAHAFRATADWNTWATSTVTTPVTAGGAVTTGGEGGLLGVAVDPDWSANHYVYFMHTASEGNRVARMTYDGSTLGGYKVLLKGIKKNKYHNGGRLAFGPDGYLYASTGEAQDRDLAQDKNSLNGKVLRMTRDGKAAPGNPFGNHVYSYGHRNPQGLAFDRDGRLWEAEFGDSSKDELNLIQPGRNYGWPICEGICSTAGMTDPKKTWKVSEASPSGIAVVRNVIYMAALRGERLWRVPIDGENLGTPTAYYVGSYGRLRTVTAVPGRDELWLSTTNCDINGKEPPGADELFRVSIT
ncbi:PQQ-dependent sugar dehydrogenase [Streptomyces sp. MMS24-I29]|uniref:PQQ-dependent sugar dehydrogenase n=1 Tax=Streptomyces sp. MMS24-I29 TaxID=3351480 RepID=UPI003C7C9AA6